MPPTNNGVMEDSSAAPVPLPLARRTQPVEYQMIKEAQERRERMHEAIDQIEDFIDSVAW
jgi:hypothetical protein